MKFYLLLLQIKYLVLILGLGMGYAAYMMHLKDNVSKVTVIEHDPEVIELFEKYTLPQFEHPEKVDVKRIRGKSMQSGICCTHHHLSVP